MHPRMDWEDELILLGHNVPASAQRELRRLKTLERAWDYLDKEYGNELKMTAQRVSDLNQFRFPAHIKTEEAKTLELYEIWRQVYTDLETVGCQGDLDAKSMRQGFISKFPERMMQLWIDFEEKAENIAEPPGKVLNEFLTWARDRAQKTAGYEDVAVPSTLPSRNLYLVWKESERVRTATMELIRGKNC